MSFTTTHGLCEFEYGLLRLLLQPTKRFHEKRSHTVGDVVLFEKRLAIDLVVSQVSKI